MKTNYKLLYLSLSGLLMFSSCSNDELENMNTEDGSIEISILATQGDFGSPEPQTRTEVDRWYDGSVNDPNARKGVPMKWVNTDRIGVWVGYYNFFGTEIGRSNIMLGNSLQPSETKLSTNFTGTLTNIPNKAYTMKATYVYFPYVEMNDVANLPVTIDGIQNYNGKNSIVKYDYKYNKLSGHSESITNKYSLTTSFTQLLTLLRFVVDNQGISGYLNNKGYATNPTDHVSSILLSSTKTIVGNYTYDLLANKLKGQGQKKLRVNVKQTTLENNLEVVYAVVVPRKSNKLNLSFKFGRYEITLNTLSNVNLDASKVYNIGLNENALSIEGVTIVEAKDPVKPSGKTNGNEFGKGGNAI